ALDINLEEPVEVGLGSCLQRSDVGDACVVDKYMNAAGLCQDRLNRVARLRMVRHVAGNDVSLSSLRANSFLSFPSAGFVKFDDEHVAAVPGEAYCHRLTDATACAGNHNVLMCIIEKFRHGLHGTPQC